VTRTPARAADWLIISLLVSVPVTNLAIKTLDSGTFTRTQYESLGWQANGNAARYLGLLAMLAATLFAVRAYTSGRQTPALGAVSWALLALPVWLFIAGRLQGNWEPAAIALDALSILLCFAVALSPASPDLPYRLGVAAVVIVWSAALFMILRSDLSQVSCRADKCGLGGAIEQSFFTHENLLALFIAVLLPFLAATSVIIRRCTFALGASLVLLSGSRSGLLALALAAFVLPALRGRAGGRRSLLHTILKGAPILGLLVSAYVFTFAEGLDLTGRGQIYDAVKRGLDGVAWLYGGGSDSLDYAYRYGFTSGFRAAHEHGAVPAALNNGGVVALTILVIAFLAMTRSSVGVRPGWALVTTAVIAASFPTESIWMPHVQAPFLWAYLAVLTMQSGTAPGVQATTPNAPAPAVRP
jgi:hypothetical protein